MQCPECSGVLKERKGKNGNFLGCSGYPSCKYTQALESGVDRFVRKSNEKTTTQTTTTKTPDMNKIVEEGKINLAIDRAIEYCSRTHTDNAVDKPKDLKEWAEYFLYLPDQLKDHAENLNEEI